MEAKGSRGERVRNKRGQRERCRKDEQRRNPNNRTSAVGACRTTVKGKDVLKAGRGRARVCGCVCTSICVRETICLHLCIPDFRGLLSQCHMGPVPIISILSSSETDGVETGNRWLGIY